MGHAQVREAEGDEENLFLRTHSSEGPVRQGRLGDIGGPAGNGRRDGLRESPVRQANGIDFEADGRGLPDVGVLGYG